MTWHCPFGPSADVCVELCNSFRYRFCKVPPQLCDGSAIILTFLVMVVDWPKASCFLPGHLSCPFVCFQSCERDTLEMSEPILLQIGASGAQSRG